MTTRALDRIALEQVTKSVDSVSYLQKGFSRLANMSEAAAPSLVNGIDDGGVDAEIMSSLAHCWDNEAAAVVEPREDAVS
jgi:hypothetical protein